MVVFLWNDCLLLEFLFEILAVLLLTAFSKTKMWWRQLSGRTVSVTGSQDSAFLSGPDGAAGWL
jgi:hypothetical protein